MALRNENGQSTRAATNVDQETLRMAPAKSASNHASKRAELRPAANPVVGVGNCRVLDCLEPGLPRKDDPTSGEQSKSCGDNHSQENETNTHGYSRTSATAVVYQLASSASRAKRSTVACA
jgi:hypothetical protein